MNCLLFITYFYSIVVPLPLINLTPDGWELRIKACYMILI